MATLTRNAQAPVSAPVKMHLEWDRRTQTLIERDAGYGRMIRLRDKSLLCSFERGGKSWVRKSDDNGKTWRPAVLAAQYAFGSAANPEILQLRSGRLLLFYNERPRRGGESDRDPRPRFAIGMTVSSDNGATWTPRPTIFTADADARNGCWEPAGIQRASGEILLFFANEFPYQKSDEQEISLCRSQDEGKTWSKTQAVIFRSGHRDGMPVPVLLQSAKGKEQIAIAIEDNGLANRNILQPAIITSDLPSKSGWSDPAVVGNSPRRWGAIKPPLAAEVYAGAPYLCQLPTGETLLSCQSAEGRMPANEQAHARMVVYIGDTQARNFTERSVPFDISENEAGLWNALMVKDANTVTALSSTTIDGVRGLWAIDAHVRRAP